MQSCRGAALILGRPARTVGVQAKIRKRANEKGNNPEAGFSEDCARSIQTAMARRPSTCCGNQLASLQRTGPDATGLFGSSTSCVSTKAVAGRSLSAAREAVAASYLRARVTRCAFEQVEVGRSGAPALDREHQQFAVLSKQLQLSSKKCAGMRMRQAALSMIDMAKQSGAQ